MGDRRQGERRTRRARFALPALGAVAAAMLGLPSSAAAVDPPACDPSVYPTPFLIIDGSRFIGATRYFKMRQNPHSTDDPNGRGDSDPEHPFNVNLTTNQGRHRTYTVNDYGSAQMPFTFHTGEIAHVVAKYVEVHQEYQAIGPALFVRCTRTVSKDFKKPPKKKRRHGGGGPGGGGGDDGEDNG